MHDLVNNAHRTPHIHTHTALTKVQKCGKKEERESIVGSLLCDDKHDEAREGKK